MGVAGTHQGNDEETVKQRNTVETAHEFRTDYAHSTGATFSFTSGVFGCYKNTTCPDPLRAGIKALTVQSRYTFTYKHSHSKDGIQLAATE